MILSDWLMHLRAAKGGAFYSDVAEAVEIPTLHLVRAERTMSVPALTAEELGRLAEYFGVPAEKLRQAQRLSRSDLTSYLASREKANQPVTLTLKGAGPVSGALIWRDRHAIALRQPNQSTLVVYRSAIDSWGD
jgi:hypothetical protein